MFKMTFKTVLFFVVIFFSPALAATNQFRQWYPEYRHQFQRILRENCTEEYAFYLAGQKNQTRYLQQDMWIGSSPTSQLAFPPASCVLNHSTEWMKFNMAAAAVLLGLTPSILAALGPSVEEMSSLFIIARRPLLGVFLAAGAPSLYPFRTVNYEEAVKNLQDQSSNLRPRRFARHTQYVLMAVKFIFAGGAIANNATNSLQLGMQTSCIFAPQIWYLPIMWAFLGILAHTYGAWALWMRINCDRHYESFNDWVKIQFTPINITEESPPIVETCEETMKSVVVSWWVSVNIACHIIFGTLCFSSLIFITVRDALTVIVRYMVSLLVCRAILMYELSVFRDAYRDEHKPLGNNHELQRLHMKVDSVVD
jgi:hypothetical protein